MLQTTKMVFFLFIALFLAFGTTRPSSAEAPIQEVSIETPTIEEVISTYATQYGVSPSKLLLIANCESGFKQTAIGDKGKAFGIFQFHQPTWDMFSKKMGEQLDINSSADQAKLAAWAFANNLQSHWTCARITHYVR